MDKEIAKEKKRALQYVTITVPAVSLVVSIFQFIYFVVLNKQTSFAAIMYTMVPLITGCLIAAPFWLWILTHKAKHIDH